MPIVLRYRGSSEQYEQASFWEREVAGILSSLTPDSLTYDFGPGAGTPEKFEKSTFDPRRPFDIEWFYEDKLVAYVEVTSRPNLTFGYFPSLLLRDYKVEALPEFEAVFFVYVLVKDPREKFYWTHRDNARNYPKKTINTWIPELKRYEIQTNYEVGNEAWKPGLKELASSLSELIIT